MLIMPRQFSFIFYIYWMTSSVCSVFSFWRMWQQLKFIFWQSFNKQTSQNQEQKKTWNSQPRQFQIKCHLLFTDWRKKTNNLENQLLHMKFICWAFKCACQANPEHKYPLVNLSSLNDLTKVNIYNNKKQHSFPRRHTHKAQAPSSIK